MSSASHRPVFPLVLTVMTIALGLLAGPVAARPIVAPAKKAVVTHRARRVNRRHRKAHRAPAHRGAHTATAARRRPSHPHKPPVQHHTTPPPPPVTPPPPPPSAPSSPGTPPQTPGPPPVTTPPPPSGTLAWTGNFETGSISQWLPNSGGAQCANYGVPSANYHDRGTLSLDSGVVGDGRLSGRVDLPATVAPYTTSVCELLHTVPVGLGSDEYYGFMFYVPVGWDTGTSAFWGVQIAQFHFTNVWGSPVAYQLHDDHLTLALETGSCDAVSTANPSCDWRSQADLAGGPNLPGYYVIPPGSMPQGHWYETIMHVHWAADSTGQIQTWFRQKGQSAWSQSVNVSGVPTVQWDRTVGCCATSAVDKVGAYRGPSSVPVSVWFDDVSEGPGFASVAGSMP